MVTHEKTASTVTGYSLINRSFMFPVFDVSKHSKLEAGNTVIIG